MNSDREGNPFLGAKPFEPGNRSTFFGREPELCELVSHVIANRVVILHSPPGAGKTSLVNAGLMPTLEYDEGFDVLPVGLVRGPRPTDLSAPPLGNVFVSNLLSSWANEECRGEGPPPAEATIAGFLRARPSPPAHDGLPAPRLVVIDQLEDLFTLYPAHWRDRAAFFHQLGEALDDDPCLRVVLVVQDQYLAELDTYRSVVPGRLRARFRLEGLTHEAAVAAILGPFKTSGKAIPDQLADGVARELLKFPVLLSEGDSTDVEGEYVDPLQLQLACQLLWSELPLGA